MPPTQRRPETGDPVQPVEDNAAAQPAHEAAAKSKSREVSGTVEISDERTLDLSNFHAQEKIQGEVLDAVQKAHPGKKVEVRLLSVTHQIGKGFKVDYKAEVV